MAIGASSLGRLSGTIRSPDIEETEYSLTLLAGNSLLVFGSFVDGTIISNKTCSGYYFKIIK